MTSSAAGGPPGHPDWDAFARRHADMLLVTGPVTRNMELALKKTYDAMPDPRLVVAVGACGCSGGIFGVNYATVGSVERLAASSAKLTKRFGAAHRDHPILDAKLGDRTDSK